MVEWKYCPTKGIRLCIGVIGPEEKHRYLVENVREFLCISVRHLLMLGVTVGIELVYASGNAFGNSLAYWVGHKGICLCIRCYRTRRKASSIGVIGRMEKHGHFLHKGYWYRCIWSNGNTYVLGKLPCIRQHWWSLIPPLGVIELGYSCIFSGNHCIRHYCGSLK